MSLYGIVNDKYITSASSFSIIGLPSTLASIVEDCSYESSALRYFIRVYKQIFAHWYSQLGTARHTKVAMIQTFTIQL